MKDKMTLYCRRAIAWLIEKQIITKNLVLRTVIYPSTYVEVECQVYENYNVDIDGFHDSVNNPAYWKPKGSKTFHIELLLDEEYGDIEELITDEISKQNRIHESHYRYEVISHDVKFDSPTIIERISK